MTNEVLPLDRVIAVSLLALFWYVLAALFWTRGLTPTKCLPQAGLLLGVGTRVTS